MAEPEKKKKKSVWKRVVGGFKDFFEWVERTFADPAITRTLLEDLGLPANTPMRPPEEVPEAQKNTIEGYLAKADPDELALAETIIAIQEIYEKGQVFYESLKDEEISAWELFWLISQVWVVEPVRLRKPATYAVLKIVGGITGGYDTFERFDPSLVISTLRGEPLPADYGERLAQRISAGFGIAAVVVAEKLRKAGTDDNAFEAYYGWDPDPESASPKADLISQRTGTMLFRFAGEPAVTVGLTLAGVTGEDGGPGIFAAISGELVAKAIDGELEWTMAVAAPAGTWFYIPIGDGPMEFQAGGPAEALIKATIRQRPLNEPGQPPPPTGTPLPAFDLSITDGTRLELAGFETIVEFRMTQVGIRMLVTQGKLVISLGDGDGFLSKLPGKKVEIPFALGISLDTTNGLRIEGGTRLRANLPVSASLFGVFTLQYIELSTGPSPAGGFALELSAGLSLNLGPFRASIDRLGIVVDSEGLAEQESLTAISDAIAFKPPSGIGLLVNASVVKGGGYLYVDRTRGEYAGVLELEMDLPLLGKISVKAIGLLTTKLPDGSDGWALLLLLFAQFRYQLGWGFTFNGLGGIIGLHHAPDPLALSNGLKGGIIDDILFPANPVADAPRIIPRLRTVFPIEVDTFTVGPALEIGWGTPTLVHLRLALLFEIDHALGGSESSSLSRIVVLGQLLVQVPARATGIPPIVRLLIDILGWYDYETDWLFFRARLRDSKVVGFALTGELLVSIESGEEPTLIIAAGGFHPLFVDVPRGVPATLDRMGFGLKLGKVKLEQKMYYAITPNAKHLGLNIELKAKLGPVTIEGYLGFDALVNTETDRFVAQCRFGVALKFKGKSLCGVKVDMVLEGPDSWHAVGSGSFEILWWDVDFDFDERWGDPLEVDAGLVDLRAELAGELSLASNWSARLPEGLGAAITVEPPPLGLVAHPLGDVAFLQRRAPLGVEVLHVGAKRVAGGPVTFTVAADAVTVGSRQAAASPLREHFARGMFVDLDEEKQLSTPAFERLDAGVAIGAAGFRIPAESAFGRAPLSFEDRYLVPEDAPVPEPEADPDPRHRRWVTLSFGTRGEATLSAVRSQAHFGSAARSPRHLESLIAGDGTLRATVAEPLLAVVDAVGLRPLEGDGVAPTSFTAGEQRVASRRGAVLVEAFEVAEVVG